MAHNAGPVTAQNAAWHAGAVRTYVDDVNRRRAWNHAEARCLMIRNRTPGGLNCAERWRQQSVQNTHFPVYTNGLASDFRQRRGPTLELVCCSRWLHL
jgi:hypothetical protein